MLGRALAPKQFAFVRFQHALQHLTALRGFGIRHSHPRYLEPLFRIPFGVCVTNTKRGLRDETEAPPFKIWAQLKNRGHRAKGSVISFPWNDSLVLILDLGLPCVELPQKHHDRLQYVEWLKSRNHNRLVFVLDDPLVWTATNHGRYMARADERIQTHVRRVKNCSNGRNDGDVIAKN